MQTVDHATQIRCQPRRRLSRIAVGASCLHCMLGAQLLDSHPGRRKCPQHANKEPKAEGTNATDLLTPTGKLLFAYSLRTTCDFKDVSNFSCAMAQQLNTCPWRAPKSCFLRRPRAHSPGHAPALWRTNLVAEWHVTVCLAVNAPPRPNAPLPHDICEMIRFVTESNVFYIG